MRFHTDVLLFLLPTFFFNRYCTVTEQILFLVVTVLVMVLDKVLVLDKAMALVKDMVMAMDKVQDKVLVIKKYFCISYLLFVKKELFII